VGATGEVTGTPLATGTFNFTVRAVDSTNDSATQLYQITINDPAPPPGGTGSGGDGGSSGCTGSNSGTAITTALAALAGLAAAMRRRRQEA
jgi:uncharacterized protein (TIGR03382 family)